MKGTKLITAIIILMLVSFGIAVAVEVFTGDIDFGEFPFEIRHNQIVQEQTADTQGVNKISIKAIGADIHFHPYELDTLKANFTGEIASKSHMVPELTARVSDSILYIEVEYKNSSSNLFNFSSRKLRLDIYLPENYKKQLYVKTTSGDINLGEREFSALTVESISGNVNLEEIYCQKAALSTTSGDIKISGRADELSFNSVSGSLKADSLNTDKSNIQTTSGKFSSDSFSGDIVFESVSGDLNISYYEFGNDINAETISGEIKLKLPENSKFYIDFKTTSGDTDVDFPVNIESSSLTVFKGTVVEKGNTIKVRTVSGDLSVSKTE